MTLPHGRAEDQLLTSPELFRKILEIATDAIISVDEDQKIVLFNQGAEQIFRYRAEEVLGQPLEFLLPPQFHEHHRAQVNEFRQSPRASRPMGERGSLFGRRKDGARTRSPPPVRQEAGWRYGAGFCGPLPAGW
jgi:PAS domain S-box-containing protein